MSVNSSSMFEEFYKALGIQPSQVVVGGEIRNIFKLLSFEPKFDASGQRVLTPYEILGVPPQIENGKERPIVFAIKNRVRKVGKYEGEQLNFVFKPGRVREEKTILSTLKQNYKRAIFQGNQSQAESILESIEALTGKSAGEVLGSFYDYTKFYRQMKKQLLIDMFAHFFLMYIRASVKSIKKGIIHKNRVFKPFKENSRAYLESTDEMGETEFVPILSPTEFGLGNMQKIIVNDNEGNLVNDISFVEDAPIVKTQTKININNYEAEPEENNLKETAVEEKPHETPDETEQSVKKESPFDFFDMSLTNNSFIKKSRRKIIAREHFERSTQDVVLDENLKLKEAEKELNKSKSSEYGFEG